MSNDKKIQVTGLTAYLKQLPDSKLTVLMMLLISIATGLVSALFLLREFNRILLAGVFMGIVLLWAPSIITALFTTYGFKLFGKEFPLKRSIYLSFFGLLVTCVTLIVGGFFVQGNFSALISMIIFSYAFILMLRLLVFLMLVEDSGILLSGSFAALYPLIGFAFLLLVSDSSISSFLGFSALSASVLAVKMLFSTLVLSLFTSIFLLILNAPMKRILGVSAFSLSGHFLLHWFDGSMKIEKILAEIGEKTKAIIGVIVFKTKNKVKGVVVVPYLHPGPFGEVGGAKMPAFFAEELEKKFNCPVVVLHGTATHDLNPVLTSELKKISKRISEGLRGLKTGLKLRGPLRVVNGKVKVLAFGFDDSFLGISTLHPEATEDVDFSVGLAAMKSVEKKFSKALAVDAHNCYKKGHHAILSESPLVFDYVSAFEKAGEELKKLKPKEFSVGFAFDNCEEYSLQQGIGRIGIRVIVFYSGKKTALIVFDSNNAVPKLREKIIERLKGKYDEVEVLTTDSHYVNTVEGGENPVGKRIPVEELVEKTLKLVEKAEKDLEKAEAGLKIINIDEITVLGPEKANDLVAITNSLVAILKIVGPILLVSGMFFSLLAAML